MQIKKVFGTLGIVVFLAIIVSVAPLLVEAKEYYWFSGHPAVRYNSWDIPSSLRPYISVLEYDLVYQKKSEGGKGYGVRLYLTSLGMEKGKDMSYAPWFAWYIRVNPEWASGGRSQDSVAKEIKYHCIAGYIMMTIEYYYDDLDPWWKPIFGK